MTNKNKSKRYYWIKIKDSFMTSDKVDFLMSQKDGANYIVLYQMLCLMAVNTNGELARNIGNILVPYDIEKIQRDCKFFTTDTIRVALELYKNLGMIFTQENGILKITKFENMVGSETQGAIEKREQRENKDNKGIDKGIDNVYQDNRYKILDNRDIDNRYLLNKEYSYIDNVNKEIDMHTHELLCIELTNNIKEVFPEMSEESFKTFVDTFDTLLKNYSYKNINISVRHAIDQTLEKSDNIKNPLGYLRNAIYINCEQFKNERG